MCVCVCVYVCMCVCVYVCVDADVDADADDVDELIDDVNDAYDVDVDMCKCMYSVNSLHI